MIFIIRNTKDGTKITKKHQIEQQISDSFGGCSQDFKQKKSFICFFMNGGSITFDF